jgi:hypothetical protein
MLTQVTILKHKFHFLNYFSGFMLEKAVTLLSHIKVAAAPMLFALLFKDSPINTVSHGL